MNEPCKTVINIFTCARECQVNSILASGRPGLWVSHKHSLGWFDSNAAQPIPHRSGLIGRIVLIGRLALTDLCRRTILAAREIPASLLCVVLLVSGCSYNKHLGRVPHLDGSGYTEYRVLAGGGVLRPGVIVIVSQTLGSNPPVVLTQANGPPMAPNLLGNATGAATGLLAGYAIGRGSDSGDTTTIIQGDPPAPMMEPPKAPAKPPVHPPNGRPPNNRPPHNRPPKH